MQVLLATFGFGLALILLGATAGAHGPGSKVSAAALALLCALIGLRALLTNTLAVEESGVKVKSMVRTKSFAYSELSGAEAIERPVDAYQRVA